MKSGDAIQRYLDTHDSRYVVRMSQMIEEVIVRLPIGSEFRKRASIDEGNRKIAKSVTFTVLMHYPGHVLCVDDYGRRESFLYQDLYAMLNGWEME